MGRPRLASVRTLACTLVCVSLLVPGPVAEARTAVRDRMHQRAVVERQIDRLRDHVRDRLQRLRGEISSARATLQMGRRRDPAEPTTWSMLHHLASKDERRGLRELTRWERETSRRLRGLLRRRHALNAWLQRYGIFEVCPVPGYSQIYDDFGEIVDLPKVPRHVHMGNDITAPTGATIRAPFDGYASASTSPLGGYQVSVKGARGTAFNAHLSRYGRLGFVRAGTVIGYVGATGDSTAPHDHFEWHPGHGGAVDPHALLIAACVELPGSR